MTKSGRYVMEPRRRTPVAQEVDVLVAGAGPAGIAAGIAAAREGARTLVVERFGYAGGMITGSCVVAILGVGDGFVPLARGITSELYERLAAVGGIAKQGLSRSGDYRVDAEVFKWQAAEMLAEAGAETLFHTLACEPIVRRGRVTGVVTESKSGRQALRAAVTIDCTADADLAFRAGCECENETHDVSLKYTLEGVNEAAAREFAAREPERHAAIEAEARRRNGGAAIGKAQQLKGVDITDAAALSRAETQLRRDVFEMVNYLRAHLPGWEQARVRDTWPQLGVRQSRRIRGEYRVTHDGLTAGCRFDDGIARLGATMDGYKLYAPAGCRYDIPYRCMVPVDVDGLLVAGRCVSADYLAANELRLIVPCFATGQAAGVAAAIAVRRRIAPRAVPADELRGRLRAQGVYLGDDEPGAAAASAASAGPPETVQDS